MKAAELQVCGDIQVSIDRIERRLARLRETLSKLTAALDGMPHSASANSWVESLTVEIVDGERAVAWLKAIKEMAILELQEWLTARLSDSVQCTVLLMRYGGGLQFRDIGLQLGYSERYVYRLHQRGVASLVQSKDSRKTVEVHVANVLNCSLAKYGTNS